MFVLQVRALGRRHFSAGPRIELTPAGFPEPITKLNSVREISIAIVLGLIAGYGWKQWQWKDKALRDEYYAKLRKQQIKEGYAVLD